MTTHPTALFLRRHWYVTTHAGRSLLFQILSSERSASARFLFVLFLFCLFYVSQKPTNFILSHLFGNGGTQQLDELRLRTKLPVNFHLIIMSSHSAQTVSSITSSRAQHVNDWLNGTSSVSAASSAAPSHSTIPPISKKKAPASSPPSYHSDPSPSEKPPSNASTLFPDPGSLHSSFDNQKDYKQIAEEIDDAMPLGAEASTPSRSRLGTAKSVISTVGKALPDTPVASPSLHSVSGGGGAGLAASAPSFVQNSAPTRGPAPSSFGGASRGSKIARSVKAVTNKAIQYTNTGISLTNRLAAKNDIGAPPITNGPDSVPSIRPGTSHFTEVAPVTKFAHSNALGPPVEVPNSFASVEPWFQVNEISLSALYNPETFSSGGTEATKLVMDQAWFANLALHNGIINKANAAHFNIKFTIKPSIPLEGYVTGVIVRQPMSDTRDTYAISASNYFYFDYVEFQLNNTPLTFTIPYPSTFDHKCYFSNSPSVITSNQYRFVLFFPYAVSFYFGYYTEIVDVRLYHSQLFPALPNPDSSTSENHVQYLTSDVTPTMVPFTPVANPFEHVLSLPIVETKTIVQTDPAGVSFKSVNMSSFPCNILYSCFDYYHAEVKCRFTISKGAGLSGWAAIYFDPPTSVNQIVPTGTWYVDFANGEFTLAVPYLWYRNVLPFNDGNDYNVMPAMNVDVHIVTSLNSGWKQFAITRTVTLDLERTKFYGLHVSGPIPIEFLRGSKPDNSSLEPQPPPVQKLTSDAELTPIEPDIIDDDPPNDQIITLSSLSPHYYLGLPPPVEYEDILSTEMYFARWQASFDSYFVANLWAATPHRAYGPAWSSDTANPTSVFAHPMALIAQYFMFWSGPIRLGAAIASSTSASFRLRLARSRCFYDLVPSKPALNTILTLYGVDIDASLNRSGCLDLMPDNGLPLSLACSSSQSVSQPTDGSDGLAAQYNGVVYAALLGDNGGVIDSKISLYLSFTGLPGLNFYAPCVPSFLS